mgnify:CR=1 FL=1
MFGKKGSFKRKKCFLIKIDFNRNQKFGPRIEFLVNFKIVIKMALNEFCEKSKFSRFLMENHKVVKYRICF